MEPATKLSPETEGKLATVILAATEAGYVSGITDALRIVENECDTSEALRIGKRLQAMANAKGSK